MSNDQPIKIHATYHQRLTVTVENGSRETKTIGRKAVKWAYGNKYTFSQIQSLQNKYGCFKDKEYHIIIDNWLYVFIL